MADDRPSVTIRMPPSLMNALKSASGQRSHSMNAEIVQRLMDSMSLKDVGYTGDKPVNLSGSELGLIGVWRDLSDDERRSFLVILRALITAKDAS